MIDTHAHIHDEAFDADRVAVLERAAAAGVHDIINIGTDLKTSLQAIDISNAHNMAVAIGIHPHEASSAPADLTAAFLPLRSAAQRLVAIGEIGLDYHYDHSPRETQRAVLRAQLRLAATWDLPVIFHEREALDDFVAILSEDAEYRKAMGQPHLRGVIHCFTRDTSAARIYTDTFSLRLGIGGVLTFKTAQALRDAVVTVGINHCLLETDCPYLAPIPHRGKRNEPAFIQETARQLALLFNTSIEHVIEQTNAQAQDLFPALKR